MNGLQSTDSVVIVGGGQAGATTATELRRLGFTGHIAIVGDEAYPPYIRPPLSKAYLSGTVGRDALAAIPLRMLESGDVDWIAGNPAVRIHRALRSVELADGRCLSYNKLVLATGSRPRRLSLAGAELSNLFYFRTLADVDAIRAVLSEPRNLVIVGAGYIGLEVAACTRKLGHTVSVLEGQDRVLARVVGPELSQFYERIHREHGVSISTQVRIEQFEGDSKVTHVRLGDGTRVPADLVVVGIGVVPNVELAAESGLVVDDGIVVDEYTRTSDPFIHAAGDCANHPSEFLGRRVRLESVQNALEQARAAAAAILGREQPYRPVPWFWSDQFDLRLQKVGIASNFDRSVTRGDPRTGRAFSIFYLHDDRVIAADSMCSPREFMSAKKLVAARARVNPAQLVDERVPLETLLAA